MLSENSPAIINISISISTQGAITVHNSLGDPTTVPSPAHVSAIISGSYGFHDGRLAKEREDLLSSPSVKRNSSSIVDVEHPSAKRHHTVDQGSSSDVTISNTSTKRLSSSANNLSNEVATDTPSAKIIRKGVNKWTQASLPTVHPTPSISTPSFIYSVIEVYFDPEKVSSLEQPNPRQLIQAVFSTHQAAKAKAIELWDAFVAASRFDSEHQIVEHGQDLDSPFWWKVNDKDSFVSPQTMIKITRTRVDPRGKGNAGVWVQPSIEQARIFPRRVSKEDTIKSAEKGPGLVQSSNEQVNIFPSKLLKERATGVLCRK